MTVYAILKEYISPKVGIHVHAAIIINGHKEPPIVKFAYKVNTVSLENKTSEEIYNFLERNIPKNFPVYTSEEYTNNYGKILDKLRHRFVTIDLKNFPKTLNTDLKKHTIALDTEGERASKECLELILSGKKCK
jgi:hypothetical protein